MRRCRLLQVNARTTSSRRCPDDGDLAVAKAFYLPRHLLEVPAWKVEASYRVRVGHPAEQIALLANEEGVDTIVMGHRGESFMQRWLLGSVAKRVLS